MIKTEIVKNNIENAINSNGFKVTIANVIKSKNYDVIIVGKEGNESPFTFNELLNILNVDEELENWKVSLNYGYDYGEFIGFSYMDEISRRDGIAIFKAHSNEYEDRLYTVSSIKDSFLLDGMKDDIIYIKNMDRNGDCFGARPMTYIEIYINKIGTKNRINLG